MIRKLIAGAVIIGGLAGAAVLSAQGDVSAQILRLLARTNYWTNLNTFAQTMGLKLERGILSPVPSTTDRLYNINGVLYWNGATVASGSAGVLSITGGTGITVTGTATVPIVGLSNQLTAGNCTDCNITYNAAGQITIAANGAGGGGVPSARLITTTTPIRIDGGASADLSANRTLSLANSGVAAGTYGDATNVPQCTYSALGLATTCVNVAISASAAPHNFFSATHPDTVVGSPVRGDVVIGNSTPKWTKLAVCSTGGVVGSADGIDTSCINGTRVVTYSQTTNGDSADAIRDVNPGLFNPGTAAVSTGQNWTFETDTNDSKITLAVNNRGGSGAGDTVPVYTTNGGKWNGVGPLGFGRIQIQTQSETYNSVGGAVASGGDDQVTMLTNYSKVWHGTLDGAGAGTFTAGVCGADSAGAIHCPATFEINSSANISLTTGGSTKWIRFQDQGNAAFVQMVANAFDQGYSAWGVHGFEIETRSIESVGLEMSDVNWVQDSLRTRGHVGVGCGMATSFAKNWASPAALCVQPPAQWKTAAGGTTANLDVYGAEIWAPEAAQTGPAAALVLHTEDTGNSDYNYGLSINVQNSSGGARVVGIYAQTGNSSGASTLLMRLRANASGAAPSPAALDQYDRFLVDAAGSIRMGGLPTSAGAGGIYVCVDNVGQLYKKSACP